MRKLNKLFLSILVLLFPLLYFSCAISSELIQAVGVVTDIVTDEKKMNAAKDIGESISKASEEITPENEYWIGRSVAASILMRYTPYENEKLEKYVNNIANTLILNSDYPDLYDGYHVKILDSEEMNAFATSGGHIFITRGMIECVENEDELAAAIAHEISHIQLKHSTSVIKSSRYTDVLTTATSAVLTMAEEEKLSKAMNDVVGDTINQLVTKGYSKVQEFAADSGALKLMNDAGYNPQKMVNLLEVMEQKYGSSAGGMFKTHPSPKERIKMVNKELENMEIGKDTSKHRQKRFDSIMM